MRLPSRLPNLGVVTCDPSVVTVTERGESDLLTGSRSCGDFDFWGTGKGNLVWYLIVL